MSSLRGAVSIARRAQDPLAELVKIDPKSIGVGLYQHDVDQKQLSASPGRGGGERGQPGGRGCQHRLAGAADLRGRDRAEAGREDRRLPRRRTEPFRSRAALRKVPGLGPKAFEQAAGFLRIRDGREPAGCQRHPPGELRRRRGGAGARRADAWHTPPARAQGRPGSAAGAARRSRSWPPSWARACRP